MNTKRAPATYVLPATPEVLGRMELAVAALSAKRRAGACGHQSEPVTPQRANNPYTDRLWSAAPALVMTAVSLDAFLCVLGA